MRLATNQDVKQVIKIVSEYYKDGLMGMLPAVVYYSAAKKSNLMVETWQDDEVIGFILFRYMKKINSLKLIQIAKKKNLEKSFSGIGKILINEIFDVAKQKHAKSIILEVKKINQHAIDFYESYEFQPIGEKENNLIVLEHNIS